MIVHSDVRRKPHKRGSGPVYFSEKTRAEHRLVRSSLWSHIRGSSPSVILTVPLIYMLLGPFLLLDLAVSVYQAICFPIYGIPKVARGDHLIFDRGALGYLNAIEKIGCVYCSYANGLLSYISEIAARTERRFCPIRHAVPIVRQHSQYAGFLSYGDAKAWLLKNLPAGSRRV